MRQECGKCGFSIPTRGLKSIKCKHCGHGQWKELLGFLFLMPFSCIVLEWLVVSWPETFTAVGTWPTGIWRVVRFLTILLYLLVPFPVGFYVAYAVLGTEYCKYCRRPVFWIQLLGRCRNCGTVGGFRRMLGAIVAGPILLLYVMALPLLMLECPHVFSFPPELAAADREVIRGVGEMIRFASFVWHALLALAIVFSALFGVVAFLSVLQILSTRS